MSQKNVYKNVLFRVEKRKLSFNALAAVPFRFPLSIVQFRSVPFYPVSLRFASLYSEDKCILYFSEREMPYSEYLRSRALVLHSRGLTARAIVDSLADEGLRATPQGIVKFLRRVQDTGTLERQPGSGRPSAVTPLPRGKPDAPRR